MKFSILVCLQIYSKMKSLSRICERILSVIDTFLNPERYNFFDEFLEEL